MRLRLGVGALLGKVIDERSGTFTARSTPQAPRRYNAQLTQDRAADYAYLSLGADVRFGLGDHWSARAGLDLSAFFALRQPTWDASQNFNGLDTDGGAGSPDRADDASERADVSSDARTADRFIDIFNVFPLGDGPLGVCVSCVRDRCGTQVNACLNSATCSAGLLCTIATCVTDAGGAPNLTCVLGCFMNDFNAALTASSSFSCITMECGATCMPGVGEGGVPGDGANSVVPNDSSDSSNSVDAGDAADDSSMDSTGGGETRTVD